MEESVQGITNQHYQWDRDRSLREVERLEGELDRERRNEASLQTHLRELRELETRLYERRFGNYEGTAQQIAIRITTEQTSHGWLKTRPAPEAEPPLCDAECLELLALLRDRSLDNAAEKPWTPVDPRLFPSTEDFSLLARAEREAQTAWWAMETQRKHPAFPALRTALPEEAAAHRQSS